MYDRQDSADIIDELRNELENGRGVFSKKPNVAACLQLCDRLEKSLPTEADEQARLAEMRQEILSNADVVAKNTIRAAEERANKLVAESEIVRDAHIASKRIIENAYAQCDNLILRTKTHLDDLFRNAEDFLCSALTVVRTNREELRTALIQPSAREA